MDRNTQLEFLTPRRLSVFLAVADTILPPDDGSPTGGTLETARIVDWALKRMPPRLRSQFLLLLFVVDIMGILCGGHRFVNNSRAARIRQLRWMERSRLRPLRIGFFGLKSYACMGYYSRDAIWPSIGYAGPVDGGLPYAYPRVRAMAARQEDTP